MNQENVAEFYQDLLTRTIDLRSETPQGILTVAITGPDCAGKTTAASWLLENLKEREISTLVIEVDLYLRPRQQRTGLPNEAEDYYRRGFDFDRILSDLATLKLQSASNISDQSYIIIVEGVFLLKNNISHNWDAAFWLDISDEEILKRGTQRDADFFGSEAKAAAIYKSQIIPAQHLHRTLDDPETRATATYK